MNHNLDIDNGMEEFEESRARQAAESRLKHQPGLFDMELEDGECFTGVTINELLLTGPDTGNYEHPFSFESGYANVTGTQGKNRKASTIAIRWTRNGDQKEVSFVA